MKNDLGIYKYLAMYNLATVFRLIFLIAVVIVGGLALLIYGVGFLQLSLEAMYSDDGVTAVFGMFGSLGGTLLLVCVSLLLIVFMVVIVADILSVLRYRKSVKSLDLDVLRIHNKKRWAVTIVETILTLIITTYLLEGLVYLSFLAVILYMVICLVFSFIALVKMKKRIDE